MADELKLRLFLGAVAVVSFWLWFHFWKKARLIDDLPRSRIRSAAQGYVELSGRGRYSGAAANLAPLTRRACVWWSFKIERYESSGKHSHWRTINRGASTIPFLLDDAEHWCVVNPAGAEVFPGETSVWRGRSEWPVSTTKSGGLLGLGGGNYRYTEHRIHEHERLDIIGDFRSVGGVHGIDKERAVIELLRNWKQDQPGLLQRFDGNRDGVLSELEWERARRQARREIDERVLQDAPPVYNVLARPADGRPFLMAACDIGLIARRFRRNALLALLAFLGSVTFLAARLFGNGG